MKTRLLILAFCVLCLMAVAAAPFASERWRRFSTPDFQTTTMSRGGITSVVRATGTVKPVVAVDVGSFVSGPIEALYVDFNDEVEKGQLIAKIDPRIYEGDVARDEALLATQRSEVKRVDAILQQARNDEERGLSVRQDDPGFISDEELDKLKFARVSLEAQLEVAEANVLQAKAQLNKSKANLGYTEIRSPVDGVIIDRSVEPGQTVAAAFTTPVLFTVVPDLAGQMHIFAAVDEADIGYVKAAAEDNKPVHFTVDAYQGERFKGTISQVRSRSVIIENVVTFPVVVTTTNSDRKLMPGMTANLYFETESKDDALRVPNAAIHFFPPAKYVRPSDRKLLSPGHVPDPELEEDGKPDVMRAWMPAKDDRRHLWVVDDGQLRAVEVTIGIGDEFYTEITSGDLDEGSTVVVSIGTGA